MNRTTESGYWKTTGKDRQVVYENRTVGQIRTLIFHQGRAPKGDRTDWVMHEYRLEDKVLVDRGIVQVIIELLLFFSGVKSMLMLLIHVFLCVYFFFFLGFCFFLISLLCMWSFGFHG